MSLVAVNSFLSRPYQTLMPVFADVMLKDSSRPVVAFLCTGEDPVLNCKAPEALPLGLLLSAVGVGAMIGALLVASLPERARRGRVLTLGNLGLPLLLLIFVNSHSLLLSLVLMVFSGMGQVMQNAMANTLLQVTTPDRLRGRVMSLYSLTTQGMHHLGGLQAGFVAGIVKLAERMPPNVRNLRSVEIPGVDLQADGGPHVRNTQEIGDIRIVKIDNKGKAQRRVYFTV